MLYIESDRWLYIIYLGIMGLNYFELWEFNGYPLTVFILEPGLVDS